MSAFLKLYTDSGHSSEVSHTAQNSTTLSGATSIGATSITVASATGMPAQGYIDIDTAGTLETVAYVSISGSTLTLAKALGVAHSSGVAVVQWYYSLAVGDQVNGILNDGSNASANSPTNVATWYLYNAGDQTAQSVSVTLSNSSPATATGYADTQLSSTSASAGFSTSLSIASIAAAAQQQIWVAALIPSGQSPVGNPQICLVNLAYNSI